MKKMFFLALFVSMFMQLFSQGSKSHNGQVVHLYVNSNSNRITSLPKQKTAPVGSVYMVDDWMRGGIVLRDSSALTDFRFRYNMKSQFVEIEVYDSLKVLSAAKVAWLFYQNKGTTKYYETCSNYSDEYPELRNCEFVEVMTSGKAILLDKLVLDMVESNYNTAVDAGSTSDKYYVKHIYYVLLNDKLIHVKKRKGSVLKALVDKKVELKEYIKANSLKMKNPEHLRSVVEYYNSLYEAKAN